MFGVNCWLEELLARTFLREHSHQLEDAKQSISFFLVLNETNKINLDDMWFQNGGITL